MIGKDSYYLFMVETRFLYLLKENYPTNAWNDLGMGVEKLNSSLVIG